jgi:hypothetical protein
MGDNTARANVIGDVPVPITANPEGRWHGS